METINKNKTGLTFGFLLSFIHLGWSVLIGFGVAQTLLSFVFDLHMISAPIAVLPFSLTKAIGLVIMTFAAGYIFGWLMAFFLE